MNGEKLDQFFSVEFQPISSANKLLQPSEPGRRCSVFYFRGHLKNRGSSKRRTLFFYGKTTPFHSLGSPFSIYLNVTVSGYRVHEICVRFLVTETRHEKCIRIYLTLTIFGYIFLRRAPLARNSFASWIFWA